MPITRWPPVRIVAAALASCNRSCAAGIEEAALKRKSYRCASPVSHMLDLPAVPVQMCYHLSTPPRFICRATPRGTVATMCLFRRPIPPILCEFKKKKGKKKKKRHDVHHTIPNSSRSAQLLFCTLLLSWSALSRLRSSVCTHLSTSVYTHPFTQIQVHLFICTHSPGIL